MSEEKFQIGDVVILKSGGPQMTVTGHENDDAKRVKTVWYRGRDQDYGTASFKPELLCKFKS